jgi:hypothetical protein
VKKNHACAPLPERERSTCRRNAEGPARISEGSNVFLPGSFIEIHSQKPTVIVFEQRINTHHVTTP